MVVEVKLDERSYQVEISREILTDIQKYLDLNSKVLIIKDKNVSLDYLGKINNEVIISEYEANEYNKSFEYFLKFQEILINNKFSRKDIVIAYGGGVTGDLAGFVASTYKRGCTFINIPTTTLSMIDSSIGGKVAINHLGIKNIIGSFYQPNKVLIDLNVLESLDKRQINNGLVEALKMGLILDKSLFDLFLNNPHDHLEEIIYKSLSLKAKIVQEDEKELGLRKILNFGHTIGHAIESLNFENIYHGEAVANGMLYFINDLSLRLKVIDILKSLEIDIVKIDDIDKMIQLIMNDKKANHNDIDVIMVNIVGSYEIKKMKVEEVKTILERGLK